MKAFIQRFAHKITGVLSGFDRLVFRANLRPFSLPWGGEEVAMEEGSLDAGLRRVCPKRYRETQAGHRTVGVQTAAAAHLFEFQ